jgi:hypothetical protein
MRNVLGILVPGFDGKHGGGGGSAIRCVRERMQCSGGP